MKIVFSSIFSTGSKDLFTIVTMLTVCVEVSCKLASVTSDWLSCAAVTDSQIQLQLNLGLLQQCITNCTMAIKYRPVNKEGEDGNFE